MFSHNKAWIFTVLFLLGVSKTFQKSSQRPEALWEVRPQLCNITLETEAPACPGQVLKAAGSQQSWAWAAPGVAHPLFHVMLSQHHCHLTCRNVSLLSPTLKTRDTAFYNKKNVDLLPFPEDRKTNPHTYTKQISIRDLLKRKGSWYLLMTKIMFVYICFIL